jgi:hypothetical protein
MSRKHRDHLAGVLRSGHFTDSTEYARQLGYTGRRAVIVSDGRVVSHRGADWFQFCAALRRQTRQRRAA